MSETPTLHWKDKTRLETIKLIVQQCTSFPNGLYSYQLPLIAKILDGEDVLCITATGDGKSALFAIPIVILREYNTNYHLYPQGLPTRAHPFGIMITPTKGLANTFVYQLKRDFGLSVLSYNHETISRLQRNKVNFISGILECREWDLICLDPEHLTGKDWRAITDCEFFLSNLLQCTIDETSLQPFVLGFKKKAELEEIITQSLEESLSLQNKQKRQLRKVLDNPIDPYVTSTGMSTRLGVRRQNNSGKMEYYRAQVSAEKDCIPALVNSIFQNPPLPFSQYDCIHASRKVLCGNCSTRTGVSYEFPPLPQPLDAPPLTPFIAPLESSEKKTKLSKKNAAIVQDKLKSFGSLVCNAERDKRKYRHLPDAIHFPCTLIHSLVTNFESISNCIDLDPYLLNWIHRVDYRLQLDDVLSDLCRTRQEKIPTSP
ncbi:hypothetical protein K435DRAFT_810712 [Dendrothele bispora CBS 962.96]|uniref:DEAD/DEAH-box helicase domain-containing protein n=1 Tax=Dendrothele bispora (strain CBS 962.96) TaxID=1314807 RepID=A0A4S8KU93_DENBC|nr:hypothetical protein K435DRAFT_810712 [Dendrothele bispora CBS 962.96]